jgi:hypothetical protein
MPLPWKRTSFVPAARSGCPPRRAHHGRPRQPAVPVCRSQVLARPGVRLTRARRRRLARAPDGSRTRTRTRTRTRARSQFQFRYGEVRFLKGEISASY